MGPYVPLEVVLWNPVKELKVLADANISVHKLEVVESGEGIERLLSASRASCAVRLEWNPVKELKVSKNVNPRLLPRIWWNPVKELKVSETPKHLCLVKNFVESGEGIESRRRSGPSSRT